MRTSKNGLDLIKKYEGLRLDSYKCPAGKWTIGYGHTGYVDNKPIAQGLKITQVKAEELLKNDLVIYEKAVNNYVKVPLTQNQFDALVSFTYNLGSGSLLSSTLLKLLNQKQYAEIPAQLLRWNKVGSKELSGLTKRRQAEAKLWQTK